MTAARRIIWKMYIGPWTQKVEDPWAGRTITGVIMEKAGEWNLWQGKTGDPHKTSPWNPQAVAETWSLDPSVGSRVTNPVLRCSASELSLLYILKIPLSFKNSLRSSSRSVITVSLWIKYSNVPTLNFTGTGIVVLLLATLFSCKKNGNFFTLSFVLESLHIFNDSMYWVVG